MRLNKKAFTILELLTIIIILSVLLVILIPTVRKVAMSSEESIRESKIKTIVTAAQNYGNDAINDYQTCLGSLSSNELEKKCTVEISELIKSGYIKGDEGDVIKDPVSKNTLNGKALLCYNPSTTHIYANFIENGIYSCKTIDVDGNHILDLSSDGASIFIGSTSTIESDIISAGVFKGNFSLFVNIDDRPYINYKIEDNKKIIIKVTDEDLPITGDFKEIDLALRGNYVDKDGKDKYLEKHFTVKIYKSSLSISEPKESCMPLGGTDEADVFASNAGMIEINSSNDNILNATLRDNKLMVTAGQEPGEGTITITEKNGNNSVTYSRTVYDLHIESGNDEVVINSRETVKLIHKSAGEVLITSTNPEVLKLSYPNSSTLSDSLIISDDNIEEFQVVGVSVGDASIVIEGSEGRCGKLDKNFSVINMSLEKLNGTIYIGGKSIQNVIHAKNLNGLRCTSSNPRAAQCSINNNILTVTPGSVSARDIDITVSSEASGMASMKVDVLNTSISVINDEEQAVREICSETGSGINSQEVKVRGENMGGVKISSNNNIVNTSVSQESSDSRVHLIEADRGKNTGRSLITVEEENGHKTASFYYNLYSLTINKNEASINVGSSTQFEITARATGKITIENKNSDIVSIENDDDGNYDTSNNAVKKIKINVLGKKTGTAKIKVRGSLCGDREFTVYVTEQEFSLNLLKGSYTSELVTNRLYCSISEINSSCSVTLPEFYTTDRFYVVGYSSKKDDTNSQYNGRDKLNLNSENTGMTLYANSIENTKPKCEFKNVPNAVSKNEEIDLLLECFDEDTYLTDKLLSMNDLSVSNEKGSLVSVTKRSDLDKGYAYNVRIRASQYGMFKLVLRDKAIEDQFGNLNESIFTNIVVSDREAVETFEIGRLDKRDVLAQTYLNDDGTYDLEFYGVGEMHGFLNDEFPSFAPWTEDMYWKNIKTVKFEEGITNIGSFAFNNVLGIQNLYFADSIASIEESAFDGAQLKTLDLPQSLVKIGKRAFYYNFISDLVLPPNLEEIGESAFTSTFDTKLENLDLSRCSKLKKIGIRAFLYHNFRELIIPDSVLEIAEYAFYQSKSTLNSLSFGENAQIKVIGDYAFAGTQLSTFSLPESIEVLGDYSISSLNSIKSVKIGSKLREFGEAAITGIQLEEFVVDTNNNNFTSLDGVLFSNDMRILVKCPDDYKKSTTFSVPSSVLELAKGSFIGTVNVSSEGFILEFNPGIQNLNIESNFKGMSISSISINNNNYETVDGVLFSKDKTIAYRLPCAYKNTTYTLPSSTRMVYDYFGYANYKVNNITVSSGVESIGSKAFLSDAKYSYQAINLQVNDNTTMGEDAFGLMNYDGKDEFSNRRITVKTNALKLLLDKEYEEKYLKNIVVSVS